MPAPLKPIKPDGIGNMDIARHGVGGYNTSLNLALPKAAHDPLYQTLNQACVIRKQYEAGLEQWNKAYASWQMLRTPENIALMVEERFQSWCAKTRASAKMKVSALSAAKRYMGKQDLGNSLGAELRVKTTASGVQKWLNISGLLKLSASWIG